MSSTPHIGDGAAGERGHAVHGGNVVTRAVTAFGRFWWDFLIGDTPELFLATLVVIGLAEALHHEGVLGIIVVLASVIAFLGLSTWKGRKRIK